MKKFLVLLVLTLPLGACSWDSVTAGIQIATTGVQSPITKQDLSNFENGMIIAFAGLNAYKRACVAGAVDVHCKDNIRALQVYTRQLPPLLAQARAFVKSGDQVNAKLVYNTLTDLYSRFKTLAAVNNVKVQ